MKRDFLLDNSFGWLLGWTDATRPQPNKSILPVRSDALPAFSHGGEEILFLFGRDLITWDVADSMLTGVEAVSLDLDMPSGAHLDLIIPVRTTLGAFSSEVIPLLSNSQFELVALLVVFYTGAGELLIDDPHLPTFILFRSTFAARIFASTTNAGSVFVINIALVALDFLKGCG